MHVQGTKQCMEHSLWRRKLLFGLLRAQPLESERTRVWRLALSQFCWMLWVSYKSLPQLPHLQKGDTNTYAVQFLWGLAEILPVNDLAQFPVPVPSKCPLNRKLLLLLLLESLPVGIISQPIFGLIIIIHQWLRMIIIWMNNTFINAYHPGHGGFMVNKTWPLPWRGTQSNSDSGASLPNFFVHFLPYQVCSANTNQLVVAI